MHETRHDRPPSWEERRCLINCIPSPTWHRQSQPMYPTLEISLILSTSAEAYLSKENERSPDMKFNKQIKGKEHDTAPWWVEALRCWASIVSAQQKSVQSFWASVSFWVNKTNRAMVWLLIHFCYEVSYSICVNCYFGKFCNRAKENKNIQPVCSSGRAHI